MKHFDWWWALLIGMFNMLVVAIINWQLGTPAAVGRAMMVQLLLSMILPGIAGPIIKRQIYTQPPWWAYVKALVIMPLCLSSVTATVHSINQTPDVPTTVFTFWCLTVSSVTLYLYALRNQDSLAPPVRRFITKL